MELKELISAGGCTLGYDPEFFFKKDGKIIGAERVIPRDGVMGDYYGNSFKALALDGVQVEMHAKSFSCRQAGSGYIMAAMNAVKNELKKEQNKGVEACFDGVVLVPRRELDQLSDSAKILGCAPSFNYYDKNASVGVKNPVTFRKRSAGGHVHLGMTGNMLLMSADSTQPRGMARERLVPLLDILLGNQCVLLDRDPGARARRRYYGRAGEYRLPPHGLEYRTLSNFWIRSYPLMSFVMGVARQTTHVLACTLQHKVNGHKKGWEGYWDAEAALLDCVHLPTVRKAINNNDVELAWKNWQGVKEYIKTVMKQQYAGFSATNVEAFEYFAKTVQEKGFQHFWPEGVLEHWTKGSLGSGWENFAAAIDVQRRSEQGVKA